MDERRGMKRIRSAAQDHGIASLQAQRACVRRHIGAALVDDADHAQRGRDALNLQAIGAFESRQNAPDRIGQSGNVLDTARHGVNPFGVEHQPVEIGLAGAGLLRGGDVERVGGDDLDRAAVLACQLQANAVSVPFWSQLGQ